MTKRRKFVITSILLSLGFIGIQLMPSQYKFPGIGLLGLLTFFLFVWSLKEGLGKNMTLLTLILPVFFTIGVGFFWFLLPSNLFARIPIIIIYGFGIYALSLTTNIYTVASIRTIALLRAARGVGFVITLFTFFLLFDAILSLKMSVFMNSILVGIVSLPLFYQGFWSTELGRKFSNNIFYFSLISALVLVELTVILFFWPVTLVVGSLFLTVAVYMVLGLGQHRLEGRLFKQTVREYLTLGLAVFIGMLLATRWGV